MRRLAAIILTLGFATSLPAAPPEPLGDEQSRLQPGGTLEAWRPRLEQLASVGALAAQFVERRIFTFRSAPTTLTGKLRFVPERGLSLHYLTPEERTIIVDDHGVLLRDSRGRTRAAPPEAAANAQPLLHVLRFDVDALLASFALHGTTEGECWRLVFEPLDRRARRPLPRIDVTGTGARVDRIVLHPSPRQRIEIEIGETQTDATFPPEELQRFFR